MSAGTDYNTSGILGIAVKQIIFWYYFIIIIISEQDQMDDDFDDAMRLNDSFNDSLNAPLQNHSK